LRSNFRSRQSILAATNYIFAQLMTPDAAEIDYDEQAMLEQGTTDYCDAPAGDAPVELYLLERRGRPAATDGPGTDDQPDDESTTPTDDGADADHAAAHGMTTTAELDETEREADLIGRRILAMVGGGPGGAAEFAVYDRARKCHRPVEFGDIAILMRAVQGRANRYLERLAAMGIPVRAELSTGYFAAIEVETVLSLLQVIDNPRQDIPLAAVLRSPIVGLDEVQLAEIRLADRTVSFHDAMVKRAAADDQLGGQLRAFSDRVGAWRTAARRAPLSDLVWQLLESTGYLSFVAGLPGGRQRQANLVALHERARQFDRFSRQGLARFLRFIERLHTAKHDLGAISDPGLGLNCVFLTSIHKAKGLEFPVVFLPDLGKQFHQADRRDILWHRELGLGPRLAVRDRGAKYPTVAWQAIEHRLAAESLAEEMRVLYVAMTRARERLILTGSVPDLAAAAVRWAATAAGGARLPAPVVARDRTYIDWVCRALARHPDSAAALLAAQRAACPAADPPSTLGSRWQVTVLPRPAAGGADVATGVSVPVVDAMQRQSILDHATRLEPLTQPTPELAAFLADRYGWTYAHAWRAGLPAKVSVSELRRLDDLVQADEAGRIAALPVAGEVGPAGPAQSWPMPQLNEWGSRRQRINAAYRGTLVHQILGRLRFEPGLDRAALGARIAEMVAHRALAPETAALGDSEISGLEWFLGTDLGRRLAATGTDIARELPFTLAVSAGRIAGLTVGGQDLPGQAADLPAAAGDEIVLVQGIIDCLLWGPQGAELIEYKTDRLAPAEAATAADRYRVQLGLYAEAVEASFGCPVARVHLVLLYPRVILPVERAALRV
jgi:ATP-dependent helicase/nuclease subunit A